MQSTTTTQKPTSTLLGDASMPVMIASVVLASLILTVSAKVKVPFYPVEMTMQPLAVIGIGLLLGRNLAIAAVGLYLAQGAAGLPVFTGTPEKGLGVAYMMGPTGGFLAGFLVAAAVTGYAADRGWTRSLIGAVAASLVGLVAIYTPGLIYLASLIGTEKAIMFGLAPFWLKDVVAALIAAFAASALMSFKRR
ncbi:MAG: biotin transporter BioY [Pseudomonadota bacterium]